MSPPSGNLSIPLNKLNTTEIIPTLPEQISNSSENISTPPKTILIPLGKISTPPGKISTSQNSYPGPSPKIA